LQVDALPQPRGTPHEEVAAMPNTVTSFPLSARARAILRAVAEGRTEMSDSCEPDMFVDGLACCDQTLAHSLIHAGLVHPAHASQRPGRRPVALTRRGFEALLAHHAVPMPRMPEREAG
jgi:hypothetical protein